MIEQIAPNPQPDLNGREFCLYLDPQQPDHMRIEQLVRSAMARLQPPGILDVRDLDEHSLFETSTVLAYTTSGNRRNHIVGEAKILVYLGSIAVGHS